MFSSLSRQRRCLFRFENSSDPFSRSSSLRVDRLEIITHAYFQLISVLRNGKIIVSLHISDFPPSFSRRGKTPGETSRSTHALLLT